MRGILLFAYDNQVIDYSGLAVTCASLIKRRMDDNSIALVTNDQTLNRIKDRFPDWKSKIDHIVIRDPETNALNIRRYHGYVEDFHEGIYHNGARASLYDLSPFDETLVLDTDYLMLDRSLNAVWESRNSVCMSKRVISIHRSPSPDLFRLHDLSIPLYWATVFYFRKDGGAKKFFDIVNHVKSNYEYYSLLYKYSTRIYRNDFTYSVAAHLMNGHHEYGDFVGDLPIPYLVFAWDNDVLMRVDKDALIMRTKSFTGSHIPVRLDGINVHCMNKISLQEHLQDLIERCG